MVEKGMRFFSKMMTAFGIFVLAISFCGIFFGSEKGVSEMSLYRLGSLGIANATLFQGLLLTFLISAVNEILDSFRFMPAPIKMMLRMVLTVTAAVLFIYIFEWFPMNHVEAWIGFGISFLVCFTAACRFMLYEAKKESEEYQRLLRQFKEKA